MTRLTQRSIALFLFPLAATWIMMAAEGPFLAAVVARLPEATYNLAAYGVAFALAMLTEAPVIMLMTAATALARDRASFLKLRAFSWILNVIGTLMVAVTLYGPFYRWLTGTVMGLPTEVAAIAHGALWFFLPWPAAIGYRRFLQGALIRAGHTRLVAYGTLVRLVGMVLAAVVAYVALDIPGAWVGALSLSTGVVLEAVAARFMAASTVRAYLSGSMDGETPRALTFGEIAVFYYPLALTSLIGLSVQPMLTFFMGRSVAPVESLAVFPVVHALSFFFRSTALAFQDASIALIGDHFEHLRDLQRFAVSLGLVTSGGLALVAFTPVADLWFVTISGLSRGLTDFAIVPTRVIVVLPALAVWLALQRSILIEVRQTHYITVSSAVEVGTVAAVFTVLGFGLDWVGATAAFTAFVCGRAASNLYLFIASRDAHRRVRVLQAEARDRVVG